MENNCNFITIGELSKLTGVNTKSLRYYQKIGILEPAFVDSKNDYRYYTYPQIQLVSIIQFYVEMGVPLVELLPFINPETGMVNIKDQMAYGIESAKQKLEQLQTRIEQAENLAQEIERSDHILNSTEPVICKFPARICYTLPIHGNISRQQYYTLLQHILADMRKLGIGNGSEAGILSYADKMKRKSYVYVDTTVPENTIQDSSRFIKIPSQKFYCEKTDFESINHEPLEQRFGAGNIPYLLTLSELLTSEFNFHDSIFELRWNADK